MQDPSSPDSTRDDLTVSWWVVPLVVLAFVILSALTAGSNSLQFDLSVTEWIQGGDGQLARWAADTGNLIGESTYAVGVLIVTVVATVVLKRWRDLWFLLAAALLRTLATVLKGILESPRPSADQATLHEVFDGFGFPSGHATTSAVLTGTLAFLVARQFPTPRVRIAALAFWILCMGLTSFARVWVGAHWFTDTIGGSLVGVFIILVAANMSALATMWRPGSLRTAPAQSPER